MDAPNNTSHNASDYIYELVSLQANDGLIIRTDHKTAHLSETIVHILEVLIDCRPATDCSEPIIPLVGVSGRVLPAIVAWMEHHRDRGQQYNRYRDRECQTWRMPLRSTSPDSLDDSDDSVDSDDDRIKRPKRNVHLDAWDKRFVGDQSTAKLADMLGAASFLLLQELQNVCGIELAKRDTSQWIDDGGNPMVDQDQDQDDRLFGRLDGVQVQKKKRPIIEQTPGPLDDWPQD